MCVSDFGHVVRVSMGFLDSGCSSCGYSHVFFSLAMSVVEQMEALYASHQAREDATKDLVTPDPERDRPRARARRFSSWRETSSLDPVSDYVQAQIDAVWPFRCPRAHLLLPVHSLPLGRFASLISSDYDQTTGIVNKNRSMLSLVNHAVNRLHTTLSSCRSTPKHNESTVPSTRLLPHATKERG